MRFRQRACECKLEILTPPLKRFDGEKMDHIKMRKNNATRSHDRFALINKWFPLKPYKTNLIRQ